MTTTYVPFVISQIQIPQFNATFIDLTGYTNNYTITVPFNYFAQRYYVTCVSQQGVHEFTVPLVGSPDTSDISMTQGYFQTTLVYRVSSGNFEIT